MPCSRALFKRRGGPYHSAVPTVRDVFGLIDAFAPGEDSRAGRSVTLVRDLLARSPAPFFRSSYELGHLTASGVVLSPDRSSVLLVYHRRLARWLQPGGHIERDDATIEAAARREVLEETGVTPLEGTGAVVVGVDVHEIPAARGEPPHWHHDIALAFGATMQPPRPTEEVRDAVWCAVTELDRYGVDTALRLSVARAVRRASAP